LGAKQGECARVRTDPLGRRAQELAGGETGIPTGISRLGEDEKGCPRDDESSENNVKVKFLTEVGDHKSVTGK